jgi:hypothetical protein
MMELAGSPAMEDDGRDRGAQDQSRRFTPLRSYVTRARALAKEARGDLTLTRIVPPPPLQS